MKPIPEGAEATLARFNKVFVRPVTLGREFKGGLGDIDTRVHTLNSAASLEAAGYNVRFEVKIGNRFADVVAYDPNSGRIVKVLQLVKASAGGVYSPREVPAAKDIAAELQKLKVSVPVEFVVTGGR